jgi:hypothetical protein
MLDIDGGDNLNLEFSTKWSKGNLIKDDGDIGQLSIKGNAITFHIDGSGDVFARNFVGYANMHKYKVFTYGKANADATGNFYHVSKVFLYNGNDYSDFIYSSGSSNGIAFQALNHLRFCKTHIFKFAEKRPITLRIFSLHFVNL